MTRPKLAYRIDEAVEVSGIGRTTLYELIKSGAIPVVHIGRRVLVPHDGLAAYLKSLSIDGAGRAAS